MLIRALYTCQARDDDPRLRIAETTRNHWRVRRGCERVRDELADDATIFLVLTRASLVTERLDVSSNGLPIPGRRPSVSDGESTRQRQQQEGVRDHRDPVRETESP